MRNVNTVYLKVTDSQVQDQNTDCWEWFLRAFKNKMKTSLQKLNNDKNKYTKFN